MVEVESRKAKGVVAPREISQHGLLDALQGVPAQAGLVVLGAHFAAHHVWRCRCQRD